MLEKASNVTRRLPPCECPGQRRRPVVSALLGASVRSSCLRDVVRLDGSGLSRPSCQTVAASIDVSLQPFGHKFVAGVNVDSFQQLRPEIAELVRRKRRYEQDLTSVRLRSEEH